MELDEIFEKVKEIVDESCGIDADTIEYDQTIFTDLEIDSIDMVDIMFELESEYDIELKLSDLENRSKEELGGKPYEIDGVITNDGLESLKNHLSEVDQSKFVEGLTIHELVKLFTVKSLCKLVKHQLENKEV